MRKLLIAAGLVTAIALAVVPAYAAAECVLANAETGNDGAVGEACEFTADASPHGYVALTPNDWRIYVDTNGNDAFDANDTAVAQFSPTGGDQPAGQLFLTPGTTYRVEVENGCAGPACGWLGTIVVR